MAILRTRHDGGSPEHLVDGESGHRGGSAIRLAGVVVDSEARSDGDSLLMEGLESHQPPAAAAASRQARLVPDAGKSHF